MHPLPTTESRWTAGLFLGFFGLLMAGWFTLIAAFHFPDILRESPQARFDLFLKHQGVIVPAYYAMSLTAALQAFMAVALYRLVRKDGLLDMAALAAGVMAGIFQMLGFFRWIILIPALGDALSSGRMPADAVYALEKFANTYLGMTVGEHMGTLFAALWLVLVAVRLLRDALWGRALAVLALGSGVALLIASLENLVPAFAFIGSLTAALWGLYLTWVLLMAVSLLTRKPLHGAWWVLGAVFYAGNVVPAFF